MKLVLVSFFLALVILNISCSESFDFSQASLGLGLKDFSCTEAWIEVQIGSNDKTADIYIKKDDEIIRTVKVADSKTLFYFDDLLPNTAYKFDAVTYEDGKEVKSNPITFTTLDTTSHNFTWQTFEFGQHSSSTLYDVAIINENDIWAVGEIYMNDSLGSPDLKRYNTVKWNGTTWDVIRIPYNYQGTDFYNPIQSVFAFSQNDIWFCGNGVIHWDGNNFIPIPIPTNVWGPYQMNKLWGSNSNDIYIAGNSGSLAHYQNGSWTKIESGTTTNILDIWGFSDSFTSETSVYCAVSYVFQNGDRKILKIKNDKVDSLSWFSDKRVNSVWTPNNRVFYTAGDGVFENKNSSWYQVNGLPPFYSDNIRGNGLNDIFVCGDFGLLSHFNGKDWFNYNEHYIQGILFSVATKNNTVISVGLKGSKAIIIKGSRI